MEINLYNPIHIEEYILQFLCCFLFMAIIDKFTAPKKARWFYLHVWINSIVCYFSWSDVQLCLLTPKRCFGPEEHLSNTVPWMIGVVGHLYHIIAFDKIKKADCIHHILMIPIAGTIGFVFLDKPGFNFAIFGLTGLPGGLDYILLTLVKLDYIDTMTEKKLNVNIQKWFRMPLSLLGLGIFYTEFMCNTLSYGALIGALMTTWNAIYYMDDTLYNYYTKHCAKKYIVLNTDEVIEV